MSVSRHKSIQKWGVEQKLWLEKKSLIITWWMDKRGVRWESERA